MKTNFILSAENRFSRPLGQASKDLKDFEAEVSETGMSLKKLGDQQGLINEFQRVSQSLAGTEQKMGKARSEVKALVSSEAQLKSALQAKQQALKKAEKHLLDVAEAHGADSREVKAARAQVNALTKERVKANKTLKEHQAKLKGSKIFSDKLTRSFGIQSQKLGRLEDNLSSAGMNTRALGAEQVRLKRKSDAATASFEKQTASLKRMQAAQKRINDRNALKGELTSQAFETAAMAVPLGVVSKKAIDYEYAFASVSKTVDFDSEEEEAAYRSAMLRKGAELGGENAQLGIVDIVAAAGQSGIEKNKLISFAESATKMAEAFEITAKEAGKTRATWRAAMGLSSEQADDLADATNYLSNNMNAEAKDIAAVMVRHGSTAMDAGFSQNEAAALSATLVAGGATEETASTALKNISGRLTKGYAATGAEQEAMSRLGFDPEALAEAMQSDAKGTLVEVLRAIQDEDAASRGAVISQLFGEEIKGAVSKMVTTLDDEKNGLLSAFTRVANKADREGSVDEEYANKAKTLKHRLSTLYASFDYMTIALGERLNPALDVLLPPLEGMINGITWMAESLPITTSALLAGAAGLVAFKTAAIGFKLARIALGNGADRLTMSRERLNATTRNTSRFANLASSSLARLNAQLAATGRGRMGAASAGLGAGVAGFDESPGKDKKKPRKSRSRLGGVLESAAGVVGLGAMGLGVGDDGEKSKSGGKSKGRFGRMLGGMSGGLMSGGKGAGVLAIATNGIILGSSLIEGDMKGATSAAGGMAGGWAGATAGAALGTMIFPGVGTAIGGAIGALAGGELGYSLGESIYEWMQEDKTEQPPKDEKLQQITESILQSSTTKQEVKLEFKPHVTLQASGNVEQDRQSMSMIKQELEKMYPVALNQVNVSLTDGGSE